LAAAADIVLAAEHQPVVVVSAMSKVTNQLIAGARAAAEGRDTVYREIKAALLARHLAAVDALLTRSRARLDVGGFVEDRLHELEQLYRSIAVLGEVTVRGWTRSLRLGSSFRRTSWRRRCASAARGLRRSARRS
jgi:aspartate kinase